MLHRTAVLALLLSAAACGDNAKSSPDGHLADAGSGTADAPLDAPPAPSHVARIVAGDFTPGGPGVLATFDTTTLKATMGLAPAGAVGDDPLVRHIGHELFVVNRSDGNNVTILDDQALTVTEQLGTGAGTDPQDVAVVGTKLYVPTYLGKGLVVLTRGSSTTKTIDLSADDPDGDPNCASAIAVGTDVYVACGLLDTASAPRAAGEIYVVDSTTDTIRTKFALTTKNPISLFEETGDGNIAISTVLFADGTGCVEKITVGASPTSVCLVNNTALAGYASRTVFAGTTMYAAVPASDFSSQKLISFDLGTSTPTTLSKTGETINDVALCGDGTLVAGDDPFGTTVAAGIRAYSETAELTTAPQAIGLKPASTHGIVCY